MKVIVDYSDIYPNSKLAIIPDSAITRAKDPFFIPDEGDWNGLVLRGVCIDRLGKAIDPKFVNRYYSQCLTASHPCAGDRPSDLLCDWVRDGAIVVSNCDEASEIDPVFRQKLNNLICHVSNVATLKTGDLFFIADKSQPIKLKNQSADYFIDSSFGFPPLKLKIR